MSQTSEGRTPAVGTREAVDIWVDRFRGVSVGSLCRMRSSLCFVCCGIRSARIEGTTGRPLVRSPNTLFRSAAVQCGSLMGTDVALRTARSSGTRPNTNAPRWTWIWTSIGRGVERQFIARKLSTTSAIDRSSDQSNWAAFETSTANSTPGLSRCRKVLTGEPQSNHRVRRDVEQPCSGPMLQQRGPLQSRVPGAPPNPRRDALAIRAASSKRNRASSGSTPSAARIRSNRAECNIRLWSG